MEIIYVADGRYTEYENLLLERDRYRKEASLALREYTRIFGEQIIAVFRKKIECIEHKKALSYCMIYINRGERVDIAQVQAKIQEEMAEYQERLAEMIKENEACKQFQRIPERDVLLIKQVYRRIAKKLHPDLNPLTADHEELSELWHRSVVAYQCNDLRELEELEVLVDGALAALGEKTTTVNIPDIQKKIEELYAEIEQIRTTDPYMYLQLLEDQELVQEKRRELDNELREYQAYAAQLGEELKKLIIAGGTFTWEQN